MLLSFSYIDQFVLASKLVPFVQFCRGKLPFLCTRHEARPPTARAAISLMLNVDDSFLSTVIISHSRCQIGFAGRLRNFTEAQRPREPCDIRPGKMHWVATPSPARHHCVWPYHGASLLVVEPPLVF